MDWLILIGVKVTSKTLYTLHFLCALAIKSKESPLKPVHLREIAKEYSIPFKFLEQIAILMKGVGLVKGTRGKAGGYLLAESPEAIPLSRVLKATEGDFLPCAEIEGGHEAIRGLLGKIFEDGREALELRFSSVTLAQISEKARHLLEPAPMYYL